MLLLQQPTISDRPAVISETLQQHCHVGAHMETESAKKTWLSLLQSEKRLEREKGLHELKIQVEEGRLGEDERRSSEDAVLELVTSLTCSWEAKHGGLMAACVLLPNSQERFCEKLKGEILLLLEHSESRVRVVAGIYMYTVYTVHVCIYIVCVYL